MTQLFLNHYPLFPGKIHKPGWLPAPRYQTTSSEGWMRAVMDQQMDHSPYTAMVFVSCRMAFPAETCTVMVFIPSEVNLNDMLPSKVIRG